MKVLLTVALLLVSATARAQIGPDNAIRDALLLKSTQAQHIMDVASTVTVGVSLAAPCLMDRSWKCVKTEAYNVGLAEVATLLTKHFIHRERPNGVNDHSTISGHTALACAAVLNTKLWELCPVVAIERVSSNNHWPTDTMASAGITAGIVLSIHPF